MPRKKAAPTPSLPSPREQHTPREAWAPPAIPYYSSWSGCRPVPFSLSALLRDEVYYLPPWQRGQVWSPEQQVALCNAIWNGLPIAPMLFWERPHPDRGSITVVLDGQQRLCALGADVRRHDGTPCTPTAAHLDLETGRWQVGPAEGHPPITLRHLVDTRWLYQREDAGLRHTDRTVDLVIEGISRLTYYSSVAYGMGTAFAPEHAIQVFRAWNTPGVPIPQDEIESLIRAADLTWTPGELP